MYTYSTTVYVPSSELGPPNPSPASACVPPPEQKGGANSVQVRGGGESQCGRLEKKPSTLSTLWIVPSWWGRDPRACGKGGGGSQCGRLEKKPSTLSTLWIVPHGGGGPTRLRERGEGSQCGRQEKKPSTLSTLWLVPSSLI
jgi:hypothetical protein